MVTDTDCIGSCNSNYHTVTTTTVSRSKKDRQYNGLMKKHKRANNDPRNDTRKLKIEKHEQHTKPG